MAELTEPGRALVGMSGWVYPPWRGEFYPKGLVQKNELAYASAHVTSIEINGSFYSLQKPASWLAWRAATPDDFVFSVKGPRFITHIRRLDDVRLPVANFLASGVLSMGDKLGAVLWQLPPSFDFEPYLLEKFLADLPRTRLDALALAKDRDPRMSGREWLEDVADGPMRFAIEVRHPSFDNEAYFALLAKYGVAAVLADTAGKWPRFDRETTDFSYLRLHGDKRMYANGYDEEALDGWSAKLLEWRQLGRDSYTYFDNDLKARAPVDAMSLIARLRADRTSSS